MDDDGLLLNFTTSNDVTKLSAKKLASLTGKKVKGSWRDRREAYKRDHADAEVSVKHSERPARVQKSTVSRPKLTSTDRSKPAVPEGGIVSSLFSFNPDVGTTSEEHANQENSEITNAPLNDTSKFAVNDQLQTFLQNKMSLSAPTQVQSQSIPAITDAQNRNLDVVMVSQTGSGKTLGYLLPILNNLMNNPSRIDRTSGVFAVILAPTRELASQIYTVCESLCRACHYIVPGLVSGGEKKKSEKARLRKGVNILIGTPGRMADHVENKMKLNFSKVRFVILDEGDRLIELGFEETLTKILSQMPRVRTTVICSATMNAQTSRLKSLALNEPIIDIREEKDKQKENTPGQLVQRVLITPAKLRLVTLSAIINQISKKREKAIIFFSCTDSVDFHHQVFSKANAYKLHGNMSQQERIATISKFTSSESGILLTTDVASRGLDITVNEVVEYDPPFAIEDHLHRAGRTARAGHKGKATMLLLPSEEKYCEKLKSVHPNGIDIQKYQRMLQAGFSFSEWQDQATSWQLKIEKAVIAKKDDFGELAKKAFTSSIRAYTTHPHSERDIFNFRNLHLGHLAKAFALREAPKSISDPNSNHKSKRTLKQMFIDASRKTPSAIDEFNVM